MIVFTNMDTKRQNLSIVMACDEGFAMPLATSLRSLAESNQRLWPIDVHILFHSFPEELRRNVFESVPRGSLAIHWVPVDVVTLQGFSSPLGYPPMACARLLLPQIFPATMSRLLYLDADVLVLGDLGPLWETDLGSAAIGAVLDVLDELRKREVPITQDIPEVRDYFNSGVLLINLDRWREVEVSERALEYLTKKPVSQFPDQDALNVVCDGAWKKLDSAWNFQEHLNTCLWEVSPERRPNIVHFVTAMKPWNFKIATPNTTFFDSFRSRTRFARNQRQRLHDLLSGGGRNAWVHVKFGLKKYSFIRKIWNFVRVRTEPS